LQEFFEEFFIRHPRVPTVGGEDGRVQLFMGVGQPLRPLVVEIRQRPFFQLRGAIGVLGDHPRPADRPNSPLSLWERVRVRAN
jgi:hypothetical protein